MKRRFSVVLAVVVSFAPLLSWADDLTTLPPTPPAIPSSAKPPAKPVYLTGSEKAWSDFPKKPALDSETAQLDLLVTLSLQASRTPAQVAEATKDQHYHISLMTDVIDPAFKTKYPATYAVLERADKDGRYVNAMLKDENARLRPYEEHPLAVQPLFITDGYSYPSGHASGMELQARLLATLFHTNGQDVLLLKHAREVADGRVIAGVHYASDVREGMILGDLLFTELEAVPQFKDALAAAAKADNIPTAP